MKVHLFSLLVAQVTFLSTSTPWPSSLDGERNKDDVDGVDEYCLKQEMHVEVREGHSHECRGGIPLAFDACRLIFLRSPTCSILSYHNKRCYLHDTSNESFQINNISKELIKKQLVFKKNLNSPHCKYHCAREKFHSCLRESQSKARESSMDQLEKLAIVISATEDWIQSHHDGMELVKSNLQCYADTHHYTFIMNVLNPMSEAEFYFQRHVSIFHDILPKYQAVLHLDADSLVLDMSKSLDRFLNMSQNIFFHLHENGEVAASTYLVKNMPEVYCFGSLWMSIGASGLSSSANSSALLYYDTLNFDNGNLMYAIISALNYQSYRKCISAIYFTQPADFDVMSNIYHQTVVECWIQGLGHLEKSVKRAFPQMKLFFPREGYWRTQGKQGRFGEWWDELFYYCSPSTDIIGHGWKAMARTFWTHNSCDIPANRRGNGKSTKCTWLTPAQERQLASKHCLWKSPICINEVSGMNDCLISSNASCNRKNAFVKVGFDVSKVEWWQRQLCFSCP